MPPASFRTRESALSKLLKRWAGSLTSSTSLPTGVYIQWYRSRSSNQRQTRQTRMGASPKSPGQSRRLMITTIAMRLNDSSASVSSGGGRSIW